MAGFFLGWDENEASFGFAHEEPKRPHQPVDFDGDEPVCVIAPTGAGKGTGFVIPAVLLHDGPLIVTDVKGELASVCARRRRDLGHQVSILDPFDVTGFPSATLNPFDLLNLPGNSLEADAEMLTDQLGAGQEYDRDPFWTHAASNLVAGLIVAIQTIADPDMRNMPTVVDLLFQPDLKALLTSWNEKAGDHLPRLARRAFTGFVEAGDGTRRTILNVAQNYVRALGSRDVLACLKDSTIDLQNVAAGSPLDVFIVIPPDKVRSHAGLVRLWVGCLLTAIMRRREIPQKRTLMVLDEAAQLGKFSPLLTASTLMRGFGLQLLSVWQDVSQMRSQYGEDAYTIMNNAGALVAFGQSHHAAAKEYAEILGVPPGDLMRLRRDQAVVSIRGEGPRMIRRGNYLADPMFDGLYDPNPYHKWKDGKGK